MSPMSPKSGLQLRRKHQKMGVFPGSSMVEHSAVNRRVASSNLARGANFSFFLNYLETVIFSSFWFCGKLSRKCNGARFPYNRLFVFSTACRTCSAIPNW